MVFSVGAFSHVGVVTANSGDTFLSATANFANTGRIIGVALLDASGNVIPDRLVTADPGYHYNSLSTTTVPEPSSVVLVLTGLAGLSLVSWKKS